MQNRVIKHLDSPMRILNFSIQELVTYLAPFFVGALFDSLFIIPSIGIVVLVLSKRVTKRMPRRFLIRYLYWVFPTAQYNKLGKVQFPGSHIRTWIK